MVDVGPARLDELPRLVALLAILFSQEAEFMPDAAKQAQGLRAILEDPAKGRVFVAREDGRVVAMASLLCTVSTAEGGPAAWFEDLVVDPAHRGRGIGSALLSYVVSEARKQGALRLTLLTDMQNAAAHAFYRKLGFVDSSMKPMRLKL